MIRNNVLIFLFFAAVVLVSGCKEEDEGLSLEEQLELEQKAIEKQFELDQQTIEKYLADKSLDAIKHASGIYYEIINEGSGITPKDDSKITVNYTVYDLPTDVTLEDTDSAEFFLSQLYLGWRIGVPLISEGGTIKLYLPRIYADRKKVLRFHIDLTKVD